MQTVGSITKTSRYNQVQSLHHQTCITLICKACPPVPPRDVRSGQPLLEIPYARTGDAKRDSHSCTPGDPPLRASRLPSAKQTGQRSSVDKSSRSGRDAGLGPASRAVAWTKTLGASGYRPPRSNSQLSIFASMPAGTPALQQRQPEMRHRKLALDAQSRVLKPTPHPRRMEVEVELHKLHRLGIHRRPVLPPQSPNAPALSSCACWRTPAPPHCPDASCAESAPRHGRHRPNGASRAP